MTVTTTTTMDSNVVTAYDKQYLNNFFKRQLFFDVVNWYTPVGSDLKGLTVKQPVIEKLAIASTALTEGTDATPVALNDSELSMTIYEYGNAIETTSLLHLTSFTKPIQQAADALGQNQANTLDYIIRAAAVAGTYVHYAGGVTARNLLDATNDLPTYDWLVELAAMAASLDIPPFEDDQYISIVHPTMLAQLQKLTEWKAVGEYSDPKLLYTGKSGVLSAGGRFKNEVGAMAGIRFIRHPHGKVFMGAGTALQAATDIDGAAAAGDTDIDVTNATGITAGDWITIGTGATQEQVLVTAVATNNLTIQGIGNTIGNFGLKYAHADAEAVVEAPNVGALPILGPMSIQGRFATDPGKMGRAAIEWKNTAIPRRNMYHSWYWVGGFGLIDKYCVRGECALATGIYGDNQG